MPRTWDAIVIGAGPCGTLAAERLKARGMNVSVLEAGPRLRAGQRVPEVDRRMWPFTVQGPSFDWYRVRAVGGRSLLWGGWSHRFPAVVFERAGWPREGEGLERFYGQAESILGVERGLLDERYGRAAGSLGVSIVPKCGSVIAGDPWTSLCSAQGRRARTHMLATRLLHARGRARALEVVDLRTGRARLLRAHTFVLAASPIETARLLLMSDVHDRRVGRGLVDHMVASFVLLEPAAPPSREGRGAFPGSALVESFVNLDASTRQAWRGGFSIELSGPVPLEELGIERMAPSDQVERTSATVIHAIGEMFSDPCRYVELDPSQRDWLGRPVPRIHVGWTREDRLRAKDMRTACKVLADELAIPGSRLVALVDPLLPGAGHEAGTCVMGRGAEGPCDETGRFRALDNVWIADASVMPTAGDRHPTLTLLAQALRTAEAVVAHAGGACAA